MQKDCTNYDDEKCPKGLNITKQLDKNYLHFLFVGCWGNYCKGGEYEEYDVKKNKMERNRYGQSYVLQKMREYLEINPPVESLVLAGDNVYSRGANEDEINKATEIHKQIKENKKMLEKLEKYIEKEYQEEIKNGIEEEIKELEKELKKMKKGLTDMDLQLSEGFTKCFSTLEIDNYLMAIGNHDIETCEVLNKQLNFKGWFMPALYYNYVYKLQDGYNINLIFIDTNLYDKDYCKGEYPEDAREKQIAWLKSVAIKDDNMYNIVIGHIPFIANAHKQKEGKNVRKEQELYDDIENVMNTEDCNIDVYMCADEHNYQKIKLPGMPLLIISGTGGATLDETIYRNNELIDFTIEFSPSFGFIGCKISRNVRQFSFVDASR